MRKVRRAVILIALTVGLMTGAVATGAAATTPPPRGVLTKVEYTQLYAAFKGMKKVAKERGTPTHVARLTCRVLTNVSPLTSAERAECEASLIYSVRFFVFPYQVQHCEKVAATAARVRCVLFALGGFEKATRAFIRTNAASVRATNPRHFSHRCLDYLIFTPAQLRTTTALARGLKHYAAAVRTGSAGAISSAGTRLDSEIVASRQAMSLAITPSVCRHQ
jgi:hypothetical protein